MPPRSRTRTNGPTDEPSKIVHTAADISLDDDLIRYAVGAQIALVGATQRAVSAATSLSATNLNHCLAGREKFNSRQLLELDEVIVALGTDDQHTGGLAQFGVRMRQLQDRTSVSARIPPSWTRDILDTPSEDELHVLIQASALLTNFIAVTGAGKPATKVRDQYARQIAQVADRLILIAGAPPTPRNIEAQILLGSLATYAFDIVFQRLEHSLRESPLGFRVWRALTKLLMVSRGDPHLEEKLKGPLADLVPESDQLRYRSIYPARSLDLELAITIPTDWLGPNQVTTVLYNRALDIESTLRERGTAAMGLWQRAYVGGRTTDPEVVKQLDEILERFTAPEPDRPDISSGLRWVAATLMQVRGQQTRVCNDWPTVDEPWFHAVQDAAASLDRQNIPDHIRPATRNLFRHVLLQNAGVERRKAIDALSAGGWLGPVARSLERLLRDERAEPWIRIRAIFALGFMQVRNLDVRRALVRACKEAHAAVVGSSAPTHAQIHELHTALFAVGDCYGAKGAEGGAHGIRDDLRAVLTGIVDSGLTTRIESVYPIARALAYLLTFTAQPRGHDGQPDLSQTLLERMRDHPDGVTSSFCAWALDFRFATDGGIMPLLHAATRQR